MEGDEVTHKTQKTSKGDKGECFIDNGKTRKRWEEGSREGRKMVKRALKCIVCMHQFYTGAYNNALQTFANKKTKIF